MGTPKTKGIHSIKLILDFTLGFTICFTVPCLSPASNLITYIYIWIFALKDRKRCWFFCNYYAKSILDVLNLVIIKYCFKDIDY